MNRFEVHIRAVEKKMQEHIDGYKAIYAKADEERRNLDEQEQGTVIEHHRALETLKEERENAQKQLRLLREVDDLGRQIGPAISSTSTDVKVTSEPQDRVLRQARKTLGEEFVSSKSYQETIRARRESGGAGRFSTGAITLSGDTYSGMKGTLLEAAGGGGGAFLEAQTIPGVVDKLFQPLTFANLLLSGQATSNSVRYVVEGTATSGAAGVAEGGAKPQSTLGLTDTTEPIKKIATTLKVSDEMVEDVPAITSYINGRLTLFVRIEEERQLIRGTASSAEVQGLLTSRSVPVYAGGTAVGNKAVQLFKALNGVRGSSFTDPDWIALHPTDWEGIRLLADTNGQYLGGGPFYGPYGGPQGPAPGVPSLAGITDALWGKPVYVTSVVGAGTAIIGSTASAQVWRRGGLSVEATNANEDDFLNNLVAIRAEERLGLAVYRPGAFVQVNLA